MGKKGHLTFQRGHLMFGGGASAPQAAPRYTTDCIHFHLVPEAATGVTL